MIKIEQSCQLQSSTPLLVIWLLTCNICYMVWIFFPLHSGKLLSSHVLFFLSVFQALTCQKLLVALVRRKNVCTHLVALVRIKLVVMFILLCHRSMYIHGASCPCPVGQRYNREISTYHVQEGGSEFSSPILLCNYDHVPRVPTKNLHDITSLMYFTEISFPFLSQFCGVCSYISITLLYLFSVLCTY